MGSPFGSSVWLGRPWNWSLKVRGIETFLIEDSKFGGSDIVKQHLRIFLIIFELFVIKDHNNNINDGNSSSIPVTIIIVTIKTVSCMSGTIKSVNYGKQ